MEAERPSTLGTVFVHGWAASKSQWDRVLDALPAEHEAVAIDLPGHGERPDPPDYSVGTLAADVLAETAKRGLGRFDLVGHSLGATVALQAALDAPDRVRRLVLVSVPKPSDIRLRSVPLAVPGFGGLAAATLRAWYRTAAGLLDAGHSGPFSSTLLQAALGATTSVRGIRESVLELPNAPVYRHLEAVRAPVLVVTSRFDVQTPAAASRRIAGRLPNARYVQLPTIGHHPMHSSFDAFMAELTRFLGD